MDTAILRTLYFKAELGYDGTPGMFTMIHRQMTIFVKEVLLMRGIACKLDIIANRKNTSCKVFVSCCMSIERDPEWVKSLFTRLNSIRIVECNLVSDMQAAKQYQTSIYQEEIMCSTVRTCSEFDNSIDVHMRLRMIFLLKKTRRRE